MAGPLASAPTVDALRRRTVGTLVAGVALGSTGHIAAVTVAPIVAKQVSGSTALAGAPAAAVVFGAALGATILAWTMTRRGRRFGLSAGYAVGVLGAAVAVGAIVTSNLVLLLAGSLLIGFGNSSNQLARYTAADLYPPEKRASGIGIVVWGATVGAVLGPNLVEPSGRVAATFGLPSVSGPFLVPIVLVGLAAALSFARLRPDPYELAHETPAEHAASIAAPLAEVVRRPSVAAAVLALVVGQFVMVLVMTITPLHMTDHGHDLAAVGFVISAHTLGMFGLAPLSGRLVDRFGCRRVIYLGLAILALSSGLAAGAPPASGPLLAAALFLLGLGWNLEFVGGSAMLSGGLSLAERTRVQGLADGLIWSTSAIASLGSGIVAAAAGYTALGVLGSLLIVVPAAALWLRRSRVVDRVEAPAFEPIAD